MKKNTYIKNDGVHYPGILKDVKKSQLVLLPVFEAFTNSLEAIVLRNDESIKGKITIKLYSAPSLDQDTLFFTKLTIEDNGIGFNEENFNRLLRYKDDRKGFKNKGSGRIQLVHFFNKAIYESTYFNKDHFERISFVLSKSNQFIENNALIFFNDKKNVEAQGPSTILTLQEILEDESFYNALNSKDLKKALLTRYMMYFCAHSQKMPEIVIEHYRLHELIDSEVITEQDVPQVDQKQPFTINYSKFAEDGKSIITSEKYETFELKAFKIHKTQLEKNAIKLTSKDEILDHIEVQLNAIAPDEQIAENRYLFLISSEYIDEQDTNIRGELNILNRDQFKSRSDLFSNEQILLEDIEHSANSRLQIMYKEIEKANNEKIDKLEKLKEMFLLNDETLKSLTISLNDTEDKILTKVYEAEAKAEAKQDAQMKQNMADLDKLNPSESDYSEKLEEKVKEIVKQIPLQNRASLTHYVARRKLVLDIFKKILDKKLEIQKTSKQNIDEKLLHNLIFQQTTNSADNSDLWLVNEDFIYFNGISESTLGKVMIDGKQVFKDTFTEEELKHRLSLNEDRYAKRCDVLLFPQENKCIILEFKNPEVNLSQHINQINRYASLIMNYANDEFKFDTFYGYLIGENMTPEDVIDFDSDFKSAYHFDYVFRPSKPIIGKFGKSDGSIYTEIIKYSTLLERANKRNSIFLDKIKSIGRK